MSNASIFRRNLRSESLALSAVMPGLPTGDRAPFIFRSGRVGEIVATVGGTRLVRRVAN
jgi:hypothetical protein